MSSFNGINNPVPSHQVGGSFVDSAQGPMVPNHSPNAYDMQYFSQSMIDQGSDLEEDECVNVNIKSTGSSLER